MDYHEAANFLLGLRRYPSRRGIAPTADLLSHLGDPHEDLACVQVAGSNGKGTTARMVERTLREAGLSVGLYTSPHFDDLRERITVDGRPIRKRAVAEYVAAVEGHVTDRGASGDSPTFFEVLTGLALWEFDRQGVDVAVLEVGIGGKYDATSAVDPVASAVTSVTLEHTDLLGDTVSEIARDKAHVAPAGGTLVTGTAGEALAAIEEVTDEVVSVGDRSADPDVAVEYRGHRNYSEADVAIKGSDWAVETAIPTLGIHQAHNAGVAAALSRAVATALDAPLSTDDLAAGLRAAYWPGRFEVMGADPLVVLDGAHNPGACEALAETLSEFEYDRLYVVFGAFVDKDHHGMVAALPPADRVYTCQPAVGRAENPDVLATVWEKAGGGGGYEGVSAVGAVSTALDRAIATAGPDDCVVAAGSLATVAEARRRWTTANVRKRVDSEADAATVLRNANVAPGDVREVRDETVHRVLQTRVHSRQASTIRAELLSLGGECARSGVRADEELETVVMSGTLGQFDALATRLRNRPDGFGGVSRRLRRALGLGTDERPGHGGTGFDWLDRPAVMGVLNVTPDSFHDGGRYDVVDAAVDRARQMVKEGVDVIDVGGESTRPGADPVGIETERDRVLPVIEAIREAGIDKPISVDTRKAPVARAALEAGADVVNDVSGLEDPELRFATADYDAGLVVMHSNETPVDPDAGVEYDDIVEDVLAYLHERVLLAERAGIPREKIVVDPGIGFGKTAAESFELIDRLGEFEALGCPILVGHSHKSMFDLIGREHGERLSPTIAVTALATDRGADVIRVHDPAENAAAVKAALALDAPGRFAGSE
jgi:dihydropteroate synthase